MRTSLQRLVPLLALLASGQAAQAQEAQEAPRERPASIPPTLTPHTLPVVPPERGVRVRGSHRVDVIAPGEKVDTIIDRMRQGRPEVGPGDRGRMELPGPGPGKRPGSKMRGPPGGPHPGLRDRLHGGPGPFLRGDGPPAPGDRHR